MNPTPTPPEAARQAKETDLKSETRKLLKSVTTADDDIVIAELTKFADRLEGERDEAREQRDKLDREFTAVQMMALLGADIREDDTKRVKLIHTALRVALADDKARLDFMEEMRRECEGRVLSRCFLPGDKTLRENIDEFRALAPKPSPPNSRRRKGSTLAKKPRATRRRVT